jgi:hypothetical protein
MLESRVRTSPHRRGHAHPPNGQDRTRPPFELTVGRRDELGDSGMMPSGLL